MRKKRRQSCHLDIAESDFSRPRIVSYPTLRRILLKAFYVFEYLPSYAGIKSLQGKDGSRPALQFFVIPSEGLRLGDNIETEAISGRGQKHIAQGASLLIETSKDSPVISHSTWAPIVESVLNTEA